MSEGAIVIERLTEEERELAEKIRNNFHSIANWRMAAILPGGILTLITAISFSILFRDLMEDLPLEAILIIAVFSVLTIFFLSICLLYLFYFRQHNNKKIQELILLTRNQRVMLSLLSKLFKLKIAGEEICSMNEVIRAMHTVSKGRRRGFLAAAGFPQDIEPLFEYTD